VFRTISNLLSGAFVLLTTLSVSSSKSVGQAGLPRLRNMGRAYYEEEKYADALKMFQRCLALAPESAIDEINLGIVLVQLGRYGEAETHLARGERLDGSLAPYACYNRAISYKRQKLFPQAATELERMRKLDATCPDTAYNLAVVYESLGDVKNAFEELSHAVELAPDQIAPHYRRMIIAMRLGKKEVAIAERKIFTELRAADSRTRTPEELERSVYTEIVEPQRELPAPSGPVVKNPLGVKFEDVTAKVGLSPKPSEEPLLARQPLCWGDFDGDGCPDLLFLRGSLKGHIELWRNRGDGGFEEVSAQAGLPKEDVQPFAAAFGDLDHDGDNDLCVSDRGGIRFFFNQGQGKFAEAPQKLTTGSAKEPHELLLVDFDHDGDLDLYSASRAAAPIMFRNDGKGGFVPVSEEPGLCGDGNPVTHLRFLDFDDDNDVDFFLSHSSGANQLLSSMRMGRFQDIADRIGVAEPPNPHNVEVADINNDGWPDVVLLLENGEVVALLGKRLGKFEHSSFAGVESRGRALVVFDYDNDGDQDIFAAGRLFQNDGTFCDVTDAVALNLEKPDELLQAAAEDFDGDGDLDLAACWRNGRLALLRNDGANRNRWIRVSLEGLQSNRFGVSTKVEVRDEAFFQRKICMGRPLLFGLGGRERLDVLRLWWPTGVAQNILSPRVSSTVEVREKLGPPSSCPFLYVWDGERFSFLTDALDGAALGVPLGDGSFLPYGSKEDILIPGSRIRTKDGRLAIQLTGELRELVYLDRAILTAVDCPSECTVYPDERVGPRPTEQTGLYDVRNLCPPASVTDDRGADLTAVLSHLDGRYASGFALTRFHGLAEKHTLLLEFSGISGTPASPVLVLSGWVEWIDGDTLFALGQGAGPAPLGPVLEIRQPDESWRTLTDNFGVPAGIDKNVVVKLPREFSGGAMHLRITTNLQVYWDRIALGDAGTSQELALHALQLSGADLHFRGFSKIVPAERGKPPWYDYSDVTAEAPWRPQQGFLTRYGDVVPLLTEADDRLVVFGPGDELTLTFSVPPELSAGQKRDFILRLDGWIKDANPSTFAGDRVEPLPYRAMKSYPFGAEEEGSEDAPSYGEYISQYNTRTLKHDPASLRWRGLAGI